MRTDEKPSAATLHITVMGSSQVGKSALAVRYLTKRFIGEYRSDSGEHLNNVQPSFSEIIVSAFKKHYSSQINNKSFVLSCYLIAASALSIVY